MRAGVLYLVHLKLASRHQLRPLGDVFLHIRSDGHRLQRLAGQTLLEFGRFDLGVEASGA